MLVTGSLWLGAGDPSVNFIAREPSLGALVVAGQFRARKSKSWLVRLGQKPVFAYGGFRAQQYERYEHSHRHSS